jgi:hypothetical protein
MTRAINKSTDEAARMHIHVGYELANSYLDATVFGVADAERAAPTARYNAHVCGRHVGRRGDRRLFGSSCSFAGRAPFVLLAAPVAFQLLTQPFRMRLRPSHIALLIG